MLKNSCGEEAAEAIDWCNDPEEAYLLLVAQYCHSPEVQRAHLYPTFHTLIFTGYKGTLEAFNSEFNSYISRLRILSSKIDSFDQINQYL